ncbi:hypothetical protein [Psychrobacter sp. CAL346-MNA-CIBAN-0220]|uniref:hypothetical protein n=2 Tax=Gammaproteobacteria TaxID=1236 RepID=UPI0033237588
MPNFSNDNVHYSGFCEPLKRCEQQWWQARQRLITLRERQMFWFGDNSLIMWLMWQLVSYVVAAIAMMLLSKLLTMQLLLWQYMIVFGIQTLFFFIMLASKGRLANYIQSNINKEEMAGEQALNEMTILATDSIFPDIHASAPISLRHIYERYETELRLASLQCLLQKEINAGRLILGQHQLEAQVLPPELADDELTAHASEMIYKSVI